jgi:hypothetical protein
MATWAAAQTVPSLWPSLQADQPLPERQTERDTPDARGSRGNFITKHWRGGYSLPVAYWIVGIGTTVAILALAAAVGGASEALKPPLIVGAPVFITFSLFTCAAVIWQLVGVWRSAGAHITATGRRFWGTLARLAVVLGAIRAAVDFGTILLPMMNESAKVAMGVDDTAQHKLRILRGGTEVELSGGMPLGTAEALRKLLDAAPDVRVVHLNNIGGRVIEGYELYQLIRSRGLATYTATECSSACTIAFLGGKERLLGEHGKLGFHSLSFGGVDQSLLPDINAELRQTLISHGASPSFADRALSTPAKSIWYPSQEELVDAKIVSRIAKPHEFAISGLGKVPDQQSVETMLLGIPVYRAIKEKHPEVFAALAKQFADGMASGRSPTELQSEGQSIIFSKVLPHYLRTGPDRALHAYWSIQVEEMAQLSAKDPQLCVQFLFPEQRSQDFALTHLLPKELVQRDLDALTALILASMETASTAGAKPEEQLAAVMTHLAASEPATPDVLASPETFLDKPAVLCSAFLKFYQNILKQPLPTSGSILRYLASL